MYAYAQLYGNSSGMNYCRYAWILRLGNNLDLLMVVVIAHASFGQEAMSVSSVGSNDLSQT